MPEERIRIPVRGSGRTLAGVLHTPAREPIGCCVLSHGLLSSMESPKFKMMASALAEAGFAALRYDHMGCGASSGELENTSVASRLEDLDAAITSARSELGPYLALGLMGSSMGGFISTLRAADDRQVKALALWATPSFIRHRKRSAENGDGESIPVTLPDAAGFDLREVAGRVAAVLQLHGEQDELVPSSHPDELFPLFDGPKRLVKFPGGDHRFSDELIRAGAVGLTCEWMSLHLADSI